MLRIAIIRLSSMGDIIHTASIIPHLVESLKTKYKEISITWYVDSQFGDILDDCLFIKVVKIPLKQSIKEKNFKEIYKIAKNLKEQSYDFVLDFQGLLKSAIIGWLIPSKTFVGFDKNSIKERIASLFYNKKISIPYKEHILLRNATLAFLAFDLEIPTLDFLLKPKRFFAYEDFNFNISEKTKVLCVLETSKENKTYPLESFLQLASLFNKINIKPLMLSYREILCDIFIVVSKLSFMLFISNPFGF
jgi:heptosyltransferase-1